MVTALAGSLPLIAQPPTAKPLPPVPSGQLKIFVLEGQGAVHNIQTPMVANPVIEVRDRNDQPVEGAEVVFELPASGPGGLFSNQQTTARTRTNYRGQAAVSFIPNDQTGRFSIRVTATLGSQSGQAVIAQTNATRTAAAVARRGRPWYLNWKILALAGAGGAAGGYFAARGGNGAVVPTITLSPGPVVISGPR